MTICWTCGKDVVCIVNEHICHTCFDNHPILECNNCNLKQNLCGKDYFTIREMGYCNSCIYYLDGDTLHTVNDEILKNINNSGKEKSNN